MCVELDTQGEQGAMVPEGQERNRNVLNKSDVIKIKNLVSISHLCIKCVFCLADFDGSAFTATFLLSQAVINERRLHW